MTVNTVKEEIFKQKSLEIIRRSSAQVIILCGTFSSYKSDFLNQMKNVLSDKTLLFGPIFASKTFLVEHYGITLDGSLALMFYNLPVPDMTSFYKSFTVVNRPEDKLLGHIWMIYLRCSTNGPHESIYRFVYKFSLHNCSGTEQVTDFFSFHSPGLSDQVYGAVYSMARAVHNMYEFLGSEAPDKILNYPHQVRN